MLRHDRGDVSVVVLHAHVLQAIGVFRRPAAGKVARMEVADDPLLAGREQLRFLKCATACSNASSVSRFSISPMCWLM